MRICMCMYRCDQNPVELKISLSSHLLCWNASLVRLVRHTPWHNGALAHATPAGAVQHSLTRAELHRKTSAVLNSLLSSGAMQQVADTVVNSQLSSGKFQPPVIRWKCRRISRRIVGRCHFHSQSMRLSKESIIGGDSIWPTESLKYVIGLQTHEY